MWKKIPDTLRYTNYNVLAKNNDGKPVYGILDRLDGVAVCYYDSGRERIPVTHYITIEEISQLPTE